MLLLPINTDAPIYHRPVGTIGLIVVNLLVFLIADPLTTERYALHYGNGWNPLQWLTSNFVHADALHLLGNMFFLWGFGLIVEGKLGWQRFVPLYLILGITEGALEQTLFRHSQGMSIGASSAIFGLMAIALLWAPRNEVSIFYWVFVRPGMFEISVLLFAGLLLIKSLIVCGFTSISASSEFLHLLGALIGLVCGWLLLAGRYVDCEGWDLISVMKGEHLHPKTELAGSPLVDRTPVSRERRRRVKSHSSSTATSGFERFTELIHQNKPQAAWGEFQRIRQRKPNWTPAGEDLLKLARGLRKKHEWASSVETYRIGLAITDDPIARLEVAEILVLILERPQAALKVLESLQPETFNERGQSKLSQLRDQANSMIAEGIVEMRDTSWDV